VADVPCGASMDSIPPYANFRNAPATNMNKYCGRTRAGMNISYSGGSMNRTASTVNKNSRQIDGQFRYLISLSCITDTIRLEAEPLR
jgi:hypothetical protein